MAADTPAGQRHPSRRGLRWAAGALAVVLAVPLGLAAALGVALHSTAGSAWLLRQVPGLALDGPHGALLGGHGFGAARVRYADAQAREVEATGVAWQRLAWHLRPAPGQWLGLRLEGLRLDDLRLRLPTTDPPRAAPADLSMPLAVDLPDLRIARLQVDDLPPVEALQADVQLGADGGALHRLRGLDLHWQGHALQAQGQIGSTGDLPLQLQARVTSPTAAPAAGTAALPGWQALADLAGPLAAPRLTLSLQPLTTAPATPRDDATRLQLQADLQPFAAWPLGALDARLRGLDLHALWPDLPRTRLDGEARLQSTGLQAPAALSLTLTNAQPGRWDAGRLPLRRLAVRVAGRLDDRSRLDLQALDLQAADERRDLGRLQADGEWTREALRLDTTLQSLEPAGLDARLPALRLSGPLALRLAGWPPPGDRRPPAAEKRLSLDGRLEGAVLSLPRAPAARLTLQAEGRQAADGAWSLNLRQLLAQAGEAEAQARLDASGQPGRWQARGEGLLRRFDPAAWWPAAGSGHRLDGRWQADLQGRAGTALAGGTGSAPTPLALLESLRRQTQPVSGRLSLDIDDGRLAGVPLRGRVAWQRQAVGQAAKAEVALQAAGGSTLQLQARLAPDGSAPDQASGRIELPDAGALAAWSRLHPGLASLWPQAGRLVAEARTEGRWPALRSDGRAEADGLAAAGWRIDRGRARWQLDGADLDGRLEAHADLDGVTSATPRGEPARRLERVTLTLTGSRGDHGLRVDARSAVRPPAWAEPLLGPGGSAGGSAFTLEGRGRWTPVTGGARWEGRLARLRSGPVRADATPWLAADDLTATLQFDPAFALRSAELAPGRLQVVGSALRWQLARWQAAPPGAPAGDAQLRLQAQLDPLPLAPLLARWQPDFGWGGDLVVAGRADIRSGAGVEAEVLLERRTGDLTVTDEGGATGLGLTELRLGLSARDGTWHFTQAVAGSTVGVLAGSQTLRTDPRAAWPAPTTPLAGAIELRVDNLGVWGPWTPVGWRLGGALHARATLGGTAGAPQYTGRVDGRDLSARHLLQGVSLREGRLALRLAGETAQVEQFSLRGGEGWLHIGGDIGFGEAPRARLTLRADRFLALGRLDRRVVVSGDARMGLDRQALTLDGRLKVDEGLIDVSRGDAPALDGDVTVVRRAAPEAPVAEEGPPRVARETQVRLSVDLGDQLRVRGRGLNALLRGDLQLTTPGGRLRINGTVRADEGTYTAYGQNLRIDRGLVSFIGNPENPRLDILALRDQVDVRVGVAVTGSVLRPRVRLYSEPDMPDPEKLSWLVLGRAPEGVGRSDTALLQRAALALLSGEGDGSPSTTDRLTRGLGLDDITLRQSADNDVRSTVVGVGKQLTRRWYVGYERGINSTTGTWQLIYRIAQRFTLRTQAGEDPAVDLLWIWRWNGRGIPPPGALLPSRPPRASSTPSP